ncbi:PLP-dependent aminotransferase family protein [Paenibacillus rhizophilus]|uniref:PLP-dependent aminotransferase family protein n=1 Tax=Paenibacillus rhizophilus TaxID=1850366 RepID=A0A3N9P928_9BACL|nr:PLP-dependent aminotransferase family protein [Paenibacillus rhizophilus]RQW12319.1 PLP-dependent aminotransferase family protein [Paenibacillus rhizophilus]
MDVIPILSFDEYLAEYRYKYLALYHALRTEILNGNLPGGARLPSTRKLAVLYGLSRGSAAQVYDMLGADGYVKSETGRGTFVSADGFGMDGRQPAEGRMGQADVSAGNAEGSAGQAEGNAGMAQHPREAGRSGAPASEGRVAEAAVHPGRPESPLNAGARGGIRLPASEAAAIRDLTADIPLSAWARRLAEQPPVREEAAEAGSVISFRSGGMPMEHFPYAEWRSALSHAGGRRGGALGVSAPPQGDEGLRRAIAAHLRITRGIRAEAGHIVTFSGSMQGIVLLTQLLLDSGGRAVVEDPGFHGIRRAVEVSGGVPVPGFVDGSGLVPQDWDARLLFVTPSRQYPTGAVMPLARRRKLLEWAAARRAIIIEDDYDSEFRWSGRPIEPLKALDREERVVYIGSFSNTMFAGLRLGYAVLPPSLVAPTVAAKALYEPLPAGLLEQRAVARFMALGGYARHIRRMTRLFGERGRILRELLPRLPGGLFHPQPGDAGLHIYARWLRGETEFAQFRAAALRRNVDFRDAALYRMRPGEPAACFAFSHLDESELIEGMRRLALAWNDVQNEA